jgi:lipopolysaccharide transport system ATP-binding protein
LAIEVEGLSKRYRLGTQRSVGRTFGEAMGAAAARAARRVRRGGCGGAGRDAADGTGPTGGGASDFWAVRGVSFGVERGEVLGIVGGNGAGKSTLLKLLSRITPPTSGRARVRGRLASLLEVGTGFHPELSGRENVYLNGAILGMRKAEIDQRFDAIVAFAEVESFLDTPVKRYSSGMYTRLAFAVAAHLNPEIVVVDEVLAVGDQSFQQKCGTRMRETADGGRTVLLVSHNMGLIQRLCDRVLWLERGGVREIGPTDDVVARYLAHHPDAGVAVDLAELPRPHATPTTTRIVGCDVLGGDGEPTTQVRFGEPIAVRLTAHNPAADAEVGVVVGIDTAAGQRVTTALSADAGHTLRVRAGGHATLTARFDRLALVPGAYQLALQLRRGASPADTILGVVGFQVLAATWPGTPPYPGAMGLVAPHATWHAPDDADDADEPPARPHAQPDPHTRRAA